LMVLLAKSQVACSAKGGTTIVNGVQGLIKMGEAAVRLRALMGGAWTSRRGMYQQPPASQLPELRQYYGDVYRGLA
jgi:allantoin racemase